MSDYKCEIAKGKICGNEDKTCPKNKKICCQYCNARKTNEISSVGNFFQTDNECHDKCDVYQRGTQGVPMITNIPKSENIF